MGVLQTGGLDITLPGPASHSPTTLYGAPSISMVIPFLKSFEDTWAARTTSDTRRALRRCSRGQRKGRQRRSGGAAKKSTQQHQAQG